MPKDAKSKSEGIKDLQDFTASGKKSLGSAAPRANHSLHGDYVAMQNCRIGIRHIITNKTQPCTCGCHPTSPDLQPAASTNAGQSSTFGSKPPPHEMHINACHPIKPNGFPNKIDIVNRNYVKKSKDALDLHIFGTMR